MNPTQKVQATDDNKMQQRSTVLKNDTDIVLDAKNECRNAFESLLGEKIDKENKQHESLYQWFFIETIETFIKLRTQRKETEE